MSKDHEEAAFKNLVTLFTAIPIPNYPPEDIARLLHRYLSIPRDIRAEMHAVAINLAMYETSKLEALRSPFQPLSVELIGQFFSDIPVAEGDTFRRRRTAAMQELSALGVIAWDGGENAIRILALKELQKFAATMVFFEGIILARRMAEKEGNNRQRILYDKQTCLLTEVDPNGKVLRTMQLERGSETDRFLQAMHQGTEDVAIGKSDLRRLMKIPPGGLFRPAEYIKRLRLQQYFRMEGRMLFYRPYVEERPTAH